MTRYFWVLVHRYAGLYMAVFLVVSGLTGSILAFDAEINGWLNPQRGHVPVQDRPMLDGLTLRERALAIEPRARINFVPMSVMPGDAFYFAVEPRIDPATGQPFDLGYFAVYLNPYTGEEVGRVTDLSIWPVTRRNFTQFVFVLHYTLAGGEAGRWLFGIAAIVWTLDCFVGFYLTLPRRPSRRDGHELGGPRFRTSRWKQWLPSWQVTRRGTPYRINFYLHRAVGLWTWVLAFILASSSVAFNLPSVYRPLMTRVFHAPDIMSNLPNLPQPALDPALSWREAAAIGERLTAEQARRYGFTPRPAHGAMWLFYNPIKGVFSYPAHSDLDVGHHYVGTTVYFDGKTGEFRGIEFASGHNAAATFTSWVSAIHNCTVGGLPVQILVSVSGLVAAVLSVTGVFIWWKKREGRSPPRGRDA